MVFRPFKPTAVKQPIKFVSVCKPQTIINSHLICKSPTKSPRPQAETKTSQKSKSKPPTAEKTQTYGIKDPIPALICSTPGSAFPNAKAPSKSRDPRRMENNRLAAAKSRANRRAESTNRENIIAELRRQNAALLQHVAELTHSLACVHQPQFPVFEANVNPAYEAWVDGLLQ